MSTPVPFAKRVARFQAKQARLKEREEEQAAARFLKRGRVYKRLYRRRKKRADLEEVRYVLAAAREVMGYKPIVGMGGKKLSAEHVKALRAGHKRYLQKKRKAKRRPELTCGSTGGYPSFA